MLRQLYSNFRDVLNDRLVRVSPAWHRYTANRDWRKKSAAMREVTASEAFNTQPKLIYIHVPKTAGKSFMRLCERNYPGQTSIRDDDRFDADDWLQARVVGGHFFFDGFNDTSAPHLFVGVIRDPVERALSRFRWYQQRQKKRSLREQRGFDHDSMLNTIRHSNYRFQFTWNTQCRYLAGAETFVEARRVIENHPCIIGHFSEVE